MHNVLIYLIGFSGTGKFTIANEIASVIPAIIVDNQLINTPIFKIAQADGKSPLSADVWIEIANIREIVLRSMCSIAKPDSNFILTNELFHKIDDDPEIYNDVYKVATVRGSIFIPVVLTCSLDELKRRISSPERQPYYKCINHEIVENKFEKYRLLKPNHPNLLQLDVTQLTAKNAAEKIIEHIIKIAHEHTVKS